MRLVDWVSSSCKTARRHRGCAGKAETKVETWVLDSVDLFRVYLVRVPA